MLSILAVTAPFFALVAAGYAAGRLHLLPESAIPGLNVFVQCFALPAMLLRLAMATPISQLLDPAVLLCWLGAAALVVGLVLAVSWRRAGLKNAAFGALVATFPNSGFMGVPLLVGLLGPQAAGPTIAVLLIDVFVTSSLCIALAQAGDAAGHGTRRALALALRGAFGNPLPWATALGALFSVAGLGLPGPVDALVRMLADAATPVALFTVGAVLWRAGQRAGHGTRWGGVAAITAVKLFVHPALVAALALGLIVLGVPLSPEQALVLTLAAALPSASNVPLLAERYRADAGPVARVVMVSTALAFFSFSALVAWMGVQPG
ncbi:putative permease [Rubrivivax gelatinosus]|uniref:AEC family transporter n=2 Tax=Rubrivivax gelatinosus TaxID=28068 RepID=UPI0018C961E6|nr:AEC family transporter [Rubrivivax gelatinosus]MBG6080180.1 putative permease [Rubrivivax gelatinosus]